MKEPWLDRFADWLVPRIERYGPRIVGAFLSLIGISTVLLICWALAVILNSR